MQLEEIRAEMEEELTWRQREIVFLKNVMMRISKEEDRERYRKSLVVMLYAHFEGFCKTCLLIYIKVINDLNLTRKEANDYLVTLSMEGIFNGYDNLDRKCKTFKRELPDDTNFHRFYRRADLVLQFNEFLDEKLVIADSVINTESNLWYHVLKKNLFKLGIDYTVFDKYQSSINILVNKRNSIAHGSEKFGISENDCEKIQEDIVEVMNNIIKILMKNLKDESFKKLVKVEENSFANDTDNCIISDGAL